MATTGHYSQLILWGPKYGRRPRGRTATTSIDQLQSDSSLSRQDLASVMANRQEWDRLIKSVRVHPKQIDKYKNYGIASKIGFQETK